MSLHPVDPTDAWNDASVTLFDALNDEQAVAFPRLTPEQEVIADYQTGWMSLRDHPLRFLRESS